VDLVTHREKAAQAIERLGQQGVRMEVFGAREEQATVVCCDEIDASEAFVGIYAHRYGFVPAGANLSITEQEFDRARQKGIPTFCFLVDEDYPWPPRQIESEPGRTKLLAFKARLRGLLVIDYFTSPEDLAYKVAASLGRFLLTRKVKEELDRIPQTDRVSTEQGRSQVARRAARLHDLLAGARVLLVNDVPSGMSYVIQLLQGLSIDVQVSTSTADAIRWLTTGRFDAVISDMARGAVQDEGIRFLSQMRSLQLAQPVIFTVGRYDPSLGTPPYAFGITNRVDELLNLLFDAMERSRG
jgi:CheY-like chemotaxis protein